MNFFRSFSAVLLLAGFSSVWASPAMSFAAAGGNELQHVRWKAGPIKIALSSSLFKANPNIKADSDVVGAVKRAADAWAAVADVEFRFDQTERTAVSPAGISGDGVSVITAASSPDNVLFFSKDARPSAAKTRVFYNRRGAITEADIALNPFQQFSTDGTYGTFDLETTFTHEIGHLLGLRHSDVMGSIMAEKIVKNGAVAEEQSHTLSLTESDVAAAREIYGASAGDRVECCSTIAGTLTLAGARAAKGYRVWAEDAETGRVAGQAVSAADGSYKIGGLEAGKYAVYWKSSRNPAAGDIGTVELDRGTSRILDGRILADAAKFSVEFVGRVGQLSDSAVDISSRSETIVTLAGRYLDGVSRLSVTSPFLTIDPAFDTSDEIVDGRTTLNFYVKADEKTPAGVYSVFASSATGQRISLVGVLRVR